ncbi:hypothetical protein MGYG_00525 [Nannizzia gypsea CBS 118893]|uniref:LysM domain-containing protein n=1 Tax=Arthroderma gypseum (strain ATCC MYA-4604 / CBS 118893) TaxID=535722 RepID=E5R074_ARTGP|nr:hypothetical protein MGYG_00525 [Nannizzia gypsea CBS 118893]EFQ97485.1 hypothetical protein MGYG_00525 [Nannizzia gypsea CBS 118893]
MLLVSAALRKRPSRHLDFSSFVFGSAVSIHLPSCDRNNDIPSSRYTRLLCRMSVYTANASYSRTPTPSYQFTLLYSHEATPSVRGPALSLPQRRAVTLFVKWNPGVNCNALVVGKTYCLFAGNTGPSASANPTSSPQVPTTISKPTPMTASKPSTATPPVMTTPASRPGARPSLINTGLSLSTSFTPGILPLVRIAPQPNVNPKCDKWYQVVSGDYCQKISYEFHIPPDILRVTPVLASGQGIMSVLDLPNWAVLWEGLGWLAEMKVVEVEVEVEVVDNLKISYEITRDFTK